mgnify:CR=1 FL=1
MDASIIIPCLNEEPHLYGNVEAIMRMRPLIGVKPAKAAVRTPGRARVRSSS